MKARGLFGELECQGELMRGRGGANKGELLERSAGEGFSEPDCIFVCFFKS